MSFIANANTSKELIARYHLSAKKRFGQNFIIDPSVVIKIAENCGTSPDTTVIEVGPGLGALSEQLALRSKQVIAYEIDRDLVELLKETVSNYPVKVIEGDFLEADLNQLQGIEPLVVCANVPYNITTPILFKLIESDLNLSSITLMVQKEVAQRLNAKVNTKEYNALSIMIQYLFKTDIISVVPKRCFFPEPKVDSMVIRLIPRNEPLVKDQKQFFAFLRSCFTQRRKTLNNNLKTFLDKETIEKIELIDLTRRPEDLSREEFIDLYKVIYED